MTAKTNKTIFTGFMPNMKKEDIKLACLYLLLPHKWLSLRRGKFSNIIENKLKKIFKVSHASTYDSGRSALLIALQAAGIKKGDHVLVQAYTCLVVTNAIRWAGATPIFVDIENDLNMSPLDLGKKLTPKCKALIIQHTFGKPAKTKKLISFAKTHNLITIEDCAHTFNTHTNEGKLGTIADMSIFSFGGEKPISCVRGGALLTNNKNLATKILKLKNNLPQTPILHIISHLNKYWIFSIAKPLYHLGIGKLILKISKTLHLTSHIISAKEKRGEQPKNYPAQLPNSLAHILSNQIDNHNKTNKHRQKTSKQYTNNLKQIKNITTPKTNNWSYLRYPIKVNNPKDILHKAKKQRIMLGNWYNSIVAPKPTNQSITGYITGSCPNAEKHAKHSLNLPTDQNIDSKKIKQITDIIKKSCTQ